MMKAVFLLALFAMFTVAFAFPQDIRQEEKVPVNADEEEAAGRFGYWGLSSLGGYGGGYAGHRQTYSSYGSYGSQGGFGGFGSGFGFGR
ncbi:keratin-associated protein 19-2-like [Artemia franciscana]|uniref:keratin-associated protein 19-2-like n=1 Tax=Artemia franciscana TaxID=6661 RepID=UPI0032DB1421